MVGEGWTPVHPSSRHHVRPNDRGDVLSLDSSSDLPTSTPHRPNLGLWDLGHEGEWRVVVRV